ncbi:MULTISPECIES: DUF2290 domain-containing protein [Vibrio harveyi group]|uniref:DUF2290 domain-containing protein n=1 Tax=Vibrio harveyi group TaxID=717610 RepID=UPI00146BC97D|nr:MULTISPECIES: DUF2290 domain-containing protein [Vibrio harveyi group]EJA7342049.1 DUF2290 domain-containing protein [Vibrio parahaemolyticus]MCQ9090151.1 DUF2290 domain-containing protein [Vibrio alginolyticus]MDF5024145.1 DUF2290 domain-containing protein [Vibrio parahaemolyticus]MDF5043354.1 DUF2290 domain-containing protein [Vibrio parahaemolyticus]MDF5158796.1 DUF2290 domain-containing protein [Vibrio parahaemolyticus]
MTPKDTIAAITHITTELIKSGICDDQNFPSEQKSFQETNITFDGFSDVSIALKDVSYSEIYDYLVDKRQFNFKLIDGGLIQILYCFDANGLAKHRLCYFPSPSFEAFQNDPELYLDESNYYSDVILKSILPVPIRFDFDPGNYEELTHPASHLSLGQFKNCRIPIVAPICPANFMNFILRSFYHTAAIELPLNFSSTLMDETISDSEKRVLHMSVV